MDKIKYVLTDEEIWMDGFEAGYQAGQEFVLNQIANEDDIKRLFKENECKDTKSTNTEDTD